MQADRTIKRNPIVTRFSHDSDSPSGYAVHPCAARYVKVPPAGTKVCATCLTAKSKARCEPERNDERNADAEWIKRIVRLLGGITQWSRQAGCLVNC